MYVFGSFYVYETKHVLKQKLRKPWGRPIFFEEEVVAKNVLGVPWQNIFEDCKHFLGMGRQNYFCHLVEVTLNFSDPIPNAKFQPISL